MFAHLAQTGLLLFKFFGDNMTYSLIIAFVELLNNLTGSTEFVTEAKTLAAQLKRFARYF
jgi:hypothetical protein